jgi:uncharacterized repeat protein (TIGR03803 family)
MSTERAETITAHAVRPIGAVSFSLRGFQLASKRLKVVAIACAVFAVVAPAQSAGNEPFIETVLYSFQGGSDVFPQGGLISDSSGALYGTTAQSTDSSVFGTVFKLTPPGTGQTQWTKTEIHEFLGSTDGRDPSGYLIFDSSGALYGTTAKGGGLGFGTVFKLSPPAGGQTQWTKTVIYDFKGGADGQGFVPGPGPQAGLTLDASGALYGATGGGGVANCGTVFKLTPPSDGQTQWTKTVIYDFKDRNGLEPDSKDNYRASRLTAIWMQASVTKAARVRPRFS